ncbi:unnamed protein product [Brassica rapa subsp. trilocularis]|nr:unnamed protein product [Brassica napus]CDY34178.1 BnaA02g28620D [Brassica napus]
MKFCCIRSNEISWSMSSNRLSAKLNIDAFLEQACSYVKSSSSPLGWYINTSPVYRNAQTSQLSHPLAVLRAREIGELTRIFEYRSLLKRVNRISMVQNV